MEDFQIDNNEVLQNFMIETMLINPVQNIVHKLTENKFRDCDIKWLNEQLKKYSALALEILGKPFVGFTDLEFDVLNLYVKNKFLEYFNNLLNFFKTFLNII